MGTGGCKHRYEYEAVKIYLINHSFLNNWLIAKCIKFKVGKVGLFGWGLLGGKMVSE